MYSYLRLIKNMEKKINKWIDKEIKTTKEKQMFIAKQTPQNYHSILNQSENSFNL